MGKSLKTLHHPSSRNISLILIQSFLYQGEAELDYFLAAKKQCWQVTKRNLSILDTQLFQVCHLNDRMRNDLGWEPINMTGIKLCDQCRDYHLLKDTLPRAGGNEVALAYNKPFPKSTQYS